MEDIIRMLVDVVRTQHSATEGTDEKPFDMEDVVDMAMNLIGKPEGEEAVNDLTNKISEMVSNFAPDIFPPKTFDQMDNDERVSSAASMIEASMMRGTRKKEETKPYVPPKEPVSMNPDDYTYGDGNSNNDSSGDGGFNPQQAADLNDVIYNNFMQMMGLNEPKLEYPFDRSQIRYGKEKSFTEQLAEDEEEKRKEAQQTRNLSAWELAQNAIDQDEAAHEKEPYIPPVMEEPKTKSASQLAAEAIKKAQEEDRMQLEIEKQAARMMEAAKKRGKDPMQFALHQQEILRYMEKNSDDLVSFEDYEDLSPEEKLEIERQVYIEKQIEEGVDPDKVDTNVPAEYIPIEFEERRQEQLRKAEEIAAITGNSPIVGSAPSGTTETSTANIPQAPAFTEEQLRQLSQEVLRENSDMILADNADADMDSLNEMIFANIQKMMAGSGVPVEQENVDDLMNQVIAANRESQMETPSNAADEGEKQGLSAVELAMAAQRAAKPEPKVKRETKSAADLAREAQERAQAARAKLFEEEDEGITGRKFSLEKDEKIADEKREAIVAKADKAALDLDIEPKTDKTEKKDDIVQAAAKAISSDPRDKEIEEMERKLKEQESQKIQISSDPTDDEAVAALKASLAAQKAQPDDELDLDDLSMDDFDDDLFGEEEAEVKPEVKPEVETEAEHEPEPEAEETEESEEEEDAVEYVDPDEKVLGEHTQAEIDEALDNLSTLELEGEVYERARRMLLLELADSEEELDAWLLEQENKKQRALRKDIQDEEIDDLEDLDEDELEDELSEAFDEEIGESEAKTEPEPVVSVEETAEETTEEVVETSVCEEPEADKKFDAKKKVKRAQKSPQREEESSQSSAGSTEYGVSVRKPFTFKNSATYMDQFEQYIADSQENRKLSTGFKKLDTLLRYGLHKGSYFIDSEPQYLKNGFMQLIADRAAETGVDVLYISTELSRYDLMLDTISRLSYEMNGRNEKKAVSVMDIMTGEDGADISSLKDELNWYRGRISEHLFLLDQEAVEEFVDSMEDANPAKILEEMIRSIVREGSHKPVVFIDNIENIFIDASYSTMKPFMEGIRKLAKELGIPIVMSYGYAQSESEAELYPEEKEFHEFIGNLCDVFLELKYADMITEDSVELTMDDIKGMMEEGETLLIDVILRRNRRPMKASCQIQGTPKFNFYEE